MVALTASTVVTQTHYNILKRNSTGRRRFLAWLFNLMMESKAAISGGEKRNPLFAKAIVRKVGNVCM